MCQSQRGSSVILSFDVRPGKGLRTAARRGRMTGGWGVPTRRDSTTRFDDPTTAMLTIGGKTFLRRKVGYDSTESTNA
jgi:hypothetical protein